MNQLIVLKLGEEYRLLMGETETYDSNRQRSAPGKLGVFDTQGRHIGHRYIPEGWGLHRLGFEVGQEVEENGLLRDKYYFTKDKKQVYALLALMKFSVTEVSVRNGLFEGGATFSLSDPQIYTPTEEYERWQKIIAVL